MIEHQLDRWILASIDKHFRTLDMYAPFYVKGQKVSEHQEWFELTVFGPTLQQTTKGQYKVDCTIDILISLIKTSNVYRINELRGLAQLKFVNCIPVYRYGDVTKDAANDGSFVGDFLQQNETEVLNFSEGEIQRTTLEQPYLMRYEEI